MERQYKYLPYFFLGFIVFVALGFYYPYFSLAPDFKSVTLIIHIHAAALLLWVVVLIAQPFLISIRKYRTHQLVGKFTYFLMPVIVMSSIGVLRKQYYESIALKMSPVASLEALFTSATELFSIVIFYLLAIFNIRKNNVTYHMRYMICLALVFIPPSLGRTLGYWLYMKQHDTYNISILLCLSILIALIIHDRKNKSDYRPYLVALSIFLIFHVCWYVLGCPIQ